MTVTTKIRLALATLTMLALPACAASIPPGTEVADEMIDSLEITPAQKTCLHEAVSKFTVPVAAGDTWKNMDDVAESASKDNEQAQGIIDDFFVKAFKGCGVSSAVTNTSGKQDPATGTATADTKTG